jgi:hypothetical protein
VRLFLWNGTEDPGPVVRRGELGLLLGRVLELEGEV